MYNSFGTLEELFAHIAEDKNWTGANVAQHNRYPVRFVLFDNFADFNRFIIDRPTNIYKQSIDALLDTNNPDEFLSYTELSNTICDFIKRIPYNDFIIYPFSEIARFYDNINYTEFDSIVKTIRGQQAPEDAQNSHIRLYIPIVGMQGKMNKFMQDNISFVWEYKSDSEKGVYNLVLTNGTTYGVMGLEEQYSLAENLYSWLKLWEKGEDVKRTIICSSPNIYINAQNAQPDNAFTYIECHNVYEFLTMGLHLDFGVNSEPSEEELGFWEELASQIDITSFNFDEFVKEKFDTFALTNGIDFIKSWLKCDTDFERWLLTLYFRKISSSKDYVYCAIENSTQLSKSELFSNIATLIFDTPNNENHIATRKQVMKIAAEKGIKITELAETKLKTKLSAIAAAPEQGGCYKAVKLLTPLTDAELHLCIEWISKSWIRVEDIKDVFPCLFHYLQPLNINSIDTSCLWILEYFDAYRHSKVCNSQDIKVLQIINDRNADSASFLSWYNNFKTVKTILHNRQDIDIIYWIDGLGVDWVPFIRNIIYEYSKEHIFLNELYVAAADIPTTTSVNKIKLQSILPENKDLPKIGDLDSFAHSAKTYPQYIIDEMKIVDKAIRQVLDNYNGKKIAFVSDHGLTYLSQLNEGLKLGGITSDHEGRLATYQTNIIEDKKYYKLDDGKTICALTHQSLASKVDKGHGAHGGCTPEEILVPIIIVSTQKNATNYNIKVENDEIDGTNPIVKFTIKGLSTIDIPTIKYNDVTYRLQNIGIDKFESERLNLVDTATKVTVYINNTPQSTYNIKVSTGAKEDDLFDF